MKYVVIFALLIPYAASAQTIDDIRVRMSIVLDDNEAELRSYVRRELESLSNVEVVERREDIRLTLTCLHDYVYICSMVLVQPLTESVFSAEYKDYAGKVLNYIGGAVIFNVKLREIAIQSVAILDGDHIENFRKIRREELANKISVIQMKLHFLGYEVGEIDGVWGDRTAAAVRKYQADRKLVVDGAYSDELIQLLRRE